MDCFSSRELRLQSCSFSGHQVEGCLGAAEDYRRMGRGTLSVDRRATSVEELGCKGLASHGRWQARRVVVVEDRASPAGVVRVVEVHRHSRQGEA